MKKIIVAFGVAAVALGFASCNKGAENTSAASDNGIQADSLSMLLGDVQGASYLGYWDQMPDTMKAKLSKDEFLAGFKAVMQKDYNKDQAYLMGMSTAMQLLGNVSQMEDAGVKFNRSEYISHFSNAFKQDSVDQAGMTAKNEQLTLYMNEVQGLMMKKQQEMQQQAMKEAEAKAQPNIKAGKEYVEKQKKADPSIKTTESGVSYKVVNEGNGTKPGKTDNVKVKYVGKHINGEEFDSSRGEAVQFNVSGVVPGFGEILQLMAPGAKYVAYIPADKAYGNHGTNNIEPGETLVFEIEMVEVVPSASASK